MIIECDYDNGFQLVHIFISSPMDASETKITLSKSDALNLCTYLEQALQDMDRKKKEGQNGL